MICLTMTIQKIQELLNAQVFTDIPDPEREITSGCGADMVSDVIAWVKEEPVLLTGLMTPSIIRAAELLDVPLIVFVRGKVPSNEMISMAKEAGIILFSTAFSMYISCGKLYSAGIVQSGVQ
jgi:hypothetical protein